MSSASFCGYSILASEEYWFGAARGAALLKAVVASSGNAPVVVLDVGAGEGVFLRDLSRAVPDRAVHG